MRYIRVLILSIIIHLLLGLLISQIPSQRLNLKPTTFVEFLEQPELAKRPHQLPRDSKQFVRQVEIPNEIMSKEKKVAKFASEEERYVLEEQRARATDQTKNRVQNSEVRNKNSTEKNKSKQENQKITHRKTTQDKLDFRPASPFDKPQELLNLNNYQNDIAGVEISQEKQNDVAQSNEPIRELIPKFSDAERGVSSFGEVTPDHVKFGDFTALNTDRHLFYSFYARIEEKIRHRWVTYARAAAYNLANDPRRSRKDNWVTKIEIVLDPKGNFLRAILHEGSGMSTLDSAPVQAFRDARQFPNPPVEMIKEDGAIHVYYAFNVNMGPGHLAGN